MRAKLRAGETDVNGYERVMAAIEGSKPDRVPIMLHNFMMAARENGVSMEQFRQSPAAVADSFIRAIETYEYDGILVDLDTATLAGALGVPVDFPRDAPARCSGHRLERLEAVDDLPPVDISSYPTVRVWLQAVERLCDHFGDTILIRGNCDQCAFSLASMVRGLMNWMLDLTYPENHGPAHRLLDYCNQATRQFIRLMADTGAHMVSNGDSPAGPDLISPDMYREFAFGFEKDVAHYAEELGLPHVLHICGDTSLILDDMVRTGSSGLEVDHKTDARKAHSVMKDAVTFFGNIDPSGVLARGTVEQVAEKTRELLDLFSDTPRFVLNAGCALPASTPPENLRAMINEARR